MDPVTLTLAKAYADAGAGMRSMVVGRYYGPLGLLRGGGSALSNGRMSLTPIWIPRAVTLDRIAIEVTTLAATTVVRLGLYTHADGYPTALVEDFGTVDATSTGAKELTIDLDLARGGYWLAAAAQGGTPQLRLGSNGHGVMGMDSVTAVNTSAYTRDGVNAGLPATVTTPATLATTVNAVWTLVRASA